MKHLVKISFCLLLLFVAPVRAEPMLTGEVSFDAITNLYTYTYMLDTSHYDGNIVEISIHQNIGFNFEEPLPVSHTEPDNWQFVLSVGGVADSTIAGSFWAWWKDPGTSNDLATFSFTTERGVNTSPENNYALYNNSYPYPPSGFIEVGHIVGPELVNVGVSPVPENETYTMMIAGLALVGIIAKQQKGRNKGRQTKIA